MAPLPVAVFPVAPPAATDVQAADATPFGSTNVKSAPMAVLGPVFRTTAVYVVAPPAGTFRRLSVSTTPRSADGVSGSVSVAVLLPGFRSPTPNGVTVAVAARVPVAAGFGVTLTV